MRPLCLDLMEGRAEPEVREAIDVAHHAADKQVARFPDCAGNAPSPQPTSKEVGMSISNMSWTNRSLRRGLLLAIGVVAAVLVQPQIGTAQSDGPFSKFLGSWRGSGQVIGRDGNHERITCRASYSTSESGAALSQKLVCASDSYRVDISSYIVADGHSVQGHWQEATRQVQGELTGQIADGNFEGSVSGVGFTAGIHLRTSGHKQQVTISPDGGDVAKADIVLSRG
jgi:hypothetical protein